MKTHPNRSNEDNEVRGKPANKKPDHIMKAVRFKCVRLRYRAALGKTLAQCTCMILRAAPRDGSLIERRVS